MTGKARFEALLRRIYREDSRALELSLEGLSRMSEKEASASADMLEEGLASVPDAIAAAREILARRRGEGRD